MNPTLFITRTCAVTVQNIQAFGAFRTNTFVLALVIALAFLMVAVVASSLVKYEGGAHPTDPRRRRILFWTVGVTGAAFVFLYNHEWASCVVATNLQSRFMTVSVQATGLALVSYVLIGFGLSKAFSRSKIGNWFPRRR